MRVADALLTIAAGAASGCLDFDALRTDDKADLTLFEGDMAVGSSSDMAGQAKDMAGPADLAPAGTWKLVQTTPNARLNAIAGYDKNNVYAVGENSTVLRWDGTTWSNDKIPSTSLALYTVDVFTDGTNQEIWVGGASVGKVYAKSGNNWVDKNCTLGSAVYAISIAKKDDVIVVGNDRKAGSYWNGSSWLSFQHNATNGSNLRAAFSANGIYFIAGDQGGFASSSLTPPLTWNLNRDSTGTDITGIWGTGKTSLFMVGDNGKWIKYDGTQLTVMNRIDSTRVDNLTAIHGTGSDNRNIYVVGNNGAIYAYDGTTWTRETNNNVSGYTLTGVYVGDANNVWAVGYRSVDGAIFKR